MLQKIVVLTQLDEGDPCLILYGIRLALGFNRELCLFYHSTGAYQPEMIDEKLKNYQLSIHRQLPQLPVSLLIGAYKSRKLAVHLADDHEAIILVAGADSFKKVAVSLQNSPIPFLFVNTKVQPGPDFNRIVYPVDLRRQNREVLKWILYFAKYHHSEIFAIGAKDRMAADRQLVTGHLTALKNMLVKYNLPHKIYRGSLGSFRIQNEGFETARQLQAGILVLLGSSAFTLLDYLIGLPEEKIVKRSENFAVLVVNPRRETYLVCE